MKYTIEVSGDFSQYKEKVAARLSYLDSEFIFLVTEEGIDIETTESFEDTQLSEIRAKIFHQLYRERIYQETLPIRKWLYSDD